MTHLACADDSLVVHYTFDEDAGAVATDNGPHGNHGTILKAERLPELDGRQGVIRFNGGAAHIRCDAAPSLTFPGDLTLEMWARGNDPEHPGGTFLQWGRRFVLYGFGAPMAEYGDGTDKVRTVLTDDGSVLSAAWAHVAVVVEYPRIRLFRNGELLGDAYMPFPAIVPDSHARLIGSKCPMDLDELRVYRRALTTAEIRAHARRREIPTPRQDELAVDTHWYADTVTMRLSVKGADCAGHAAEMAILDGAGSKTAEPQRVVLEESVPGSGRYVASAVWPLAGLANRALDATAKVLDRGGTPVQTVYRHVDLEKPAWVDTAEGHTDEVPAPWTPVQAAARPDGTVEVGVWGRTHVFGANLFPQHIRTGDAGILAAPVALRARADGAALAWENAGVRLTQASDTAVSLEQSGGNHNLSLRMNTLIEFDGYMIFDCTIAAKRDTTLEALMLEIPLHTRHATLCFGSNVYPEQMDPRVPMSVLHMGAVDGDLAFRFSPSVWLGDEERGLTWQAESNEDWRYAEPQRAIEILPRGETTRFVANWVNVPTKLTTGQKLHYKFALQATPVKPLLRDAWDLRILRSDPYDGGVGTGNPDLNLPDRWIDRDHVRQDRIYSVFVEDLNRSEPGAGRVPALEYYAETGARHLWINTHDNWPWPWPMDAAYARKLHRLIDAAHAAGLQVYGYLIHERMPTDVPEYDVHGRHMTNLPFKPYEWCVGFCPGSKAVQDAIVYNLARRLDAYGDDGVYLDGTGVHMKSCQNTSHGCGYRPAKGATSVHGTVAFDQTARGSSGEDGPVYPTYPVFADRELLKRIYIAVKKRRPDGVLDVHSWYWNSGGLAYADVLWTGEQWWHLRGKGVKYVSAELTLDVFRTAFMGYQFGVAAETLPYRLIGDDQKNRQVAAISLLHDIPVRIRTQDTEWFDTMRRLWEVRDAFGARQADKLFYWRNREYVTVSPEECYAALLKHPENGVLAFISNLRREAGAVTVQFDLDKLGLAGRKLEVFNPLTDEAMAMAPDGRLAMDLASEDWSYVWLRP